EAAVQDAEAITRALFSGETQEMTEAQLEQACRAMPSTTIQRDEIGRLPILDLLIRARLASSKREGRDLLSAGAISINGQPVQAFDAVLSADAVRFGRFAIVRKGKKSYHAAILT